MKYILGKITLLHVLIIAVFELVSLLLIGMVGVNTSSFNPIVNAFGGIIVGFIGTLFLVVIFNLLLEAFEVYLIRQKLSHSRLRKISVTASALYCALFLFMLFFIESFTVPIKEWHIIFGNALVGMITTPLSLFLTVLIYNNIPYKIRFANNKVEKISIKGLIIVAAIYEAIALPVMAVLPEYFPRLLPQHLFILNDFISFGLIGFISGILGGTAALIFYNLFMQNSIFIECSKMNLKREKPDIRIEISEERKPGKSRKGKSRRRLKTKAAKPKKGKKISGK